MKIVRWLVAIAKKWRDDWKYRQELKALTGDLVSTLLAAKFQATVLIMKYALAYDKTEYGLKSA